MYKLGTQMGSGFERTGFVDTPNCNHSLCVKTRAPEMASAFPLGTTPEGLR